MNKLTALHYLKDNFEEVAGYRDEWVDASFAVMVRNLLDDPKDKYTTEELDKILQKTYKS